MRCFNRAARIILVALAAFASAVLNAQQGPDRAQAPPVGPPPALRIPPIETRTLSNGLQVWVMGEHKVPTVHLALTIRAGAAADPAGRYGAASFTAAMLDEGAGQRSALEIADAIDFLGADLSAAAGIDASTVDLHVPVARLSEALAVMADVVARPTFPESELKRLREERLAGLLEAQDDPEELIQLAFPHVVFGARHRYGAPVMGTETAIKAITPADLVAFHDAHYRPSNARLVVVGDVTADSLVPMLESSLGTWKPTGAGTPAPPLADPPQLTARHVYLIDKPGAAQSQIRIGWVGVQRSTPDYFALRVLSGVLGESFTSRLNHNLREVHGYAYGAGSRFDMRRVGGLFYASAGVQTDKTADALKEFFVELANIHPPIPADELARTKNFAERLVPRYFETERDAAAALSQIFTYDLPADYWESFSRRIEAVTANEVQRAADKYIQPDRFAVVIVGDRKAIEAGVRSLNLGPLTVVEPSEIVK
ncbi:MAG TPA: pitrilysin family protein [Vicinamibacterales bacterium]|jgi:predicted Zn-dependent peptidase